MYVYEDMFRTKTGNFKVTVTHEALHRVVLRKAPFIVLKSDAF